MKTIYKYRLKVTDEQNIEAPAQALWLSVGNQQDQLVAWALVDTEKVLAHHHFLIFGTGNPADPLANSHLRLHHLGTVQQFGGSLVWHVFIREDR